jgi:hypothetical protein
MARTRIAPVLSMILEIKPGLKEGTVKSVSFHNGTRTCALAQAELRAMLAVIRAAESEIRGWKGLYGSDNLNGDDPLVRALSRLSRASQPKGGAR